MNNRDKKAVYSPGNTPAANLLSKLMLADPEIGDNEKKLSEMIEKRLGEKVPQPTIHRILSGESNEPRRSSVAPIAEYYGVEIEMFYKEGLDQDDIDSAIADSESSRLLMLFLEADQRGKETILTTAKQQAEWKGPAESEQNAEAPGEVPESYKYNTDDPDLKLKKGNAQVMETEKKKPAVKKAAKKKAEPKVKTKK
ncbi:MAG: helix-turn-helix transcriptional regulator [Candidatus Thiodiazotropha sp.]